MNPRAPTRFDPDDHEDDLDRRKATSGWQKRVRTLLRVALLAAAVALAGLFLFPTPSHAGGLCDEACPTAQQVQRGMTSADSVFAWLQRSGLGSAAITRRSEASGRPTSS